MLKGRCAQSSSVAAPSTSAHSPSTCDQGVGVALTFGEGVGQRESSRTTALSTS